LLESKLKIVHTETDTLTKYKPQRKISLGLKTHYATQCLC